MLKALTQPKMPDALKRSASSQYVHLRVSNGVDVMAAGDEVTISYVSPVSMPARLRQERVASLGVDCACPRCTQEQKLPAAIRRLVETIHSEIQSQATSAQKVEKLLAKLEAKLSSTGLPEQRQHWVLFSVLGAYEYLARQALSSIAFARTCAELGIAAEGGMARQALSSKAFAKNFAQFGITAQVEGLTEASQRLQQVIQH